MNTIADDIILQCFHGGDVSVHQMEKERRPYHRNCSCALHKSEDANSRACPHHKSVTIKKKPWYRCSLSVEAPKFPLLLKNKQESSAFNIGRIEQWMIW
ncbi:hypothetical protein F511_00897 [Dorcoceras hygrometricum]|nr:hypothetical protein F511_00897 [Dorcoceras hygrometricum]